MDRNLDSDFQLTASAAARQEGVRDHGCCISTFVQHGLQVSAQSFWLAEQHTRLLGAELCGRSPHLSFSTLFVTTTTQPQVGPPLCTPSVLTAFEFPSHLQSQASRSLRQLRCALGLQILHASMLTSLPLPRSALRPWLSLMRSCTPAP